MPQGLKTWDAAGNVVMDTSTYVGRVLGMLALSNGVSGTLDVSKASSERLFGVLTLTNGGTESGFVEIRNGANAPDPNGSRLYYELSAGTAGHLVYGLY